MTTHSNYAQSLSSQGTCQEALWLPIPTLPRRAPLPAYKSGHSSPEPLLPGTLSQVQLPTAEAAEGHDGKPRGKAVGREDSKVVSYK